MMDLDWVKLHMQKQIPKVPDWAAAEGMESGVPLRRLWMIGRSSSVRYGHKSDSK